MHSINRIILFLTILLFQFEELYPQDSFENERNIFPTEVLSPQAFTISGITINHVTGCYGNSNGSIIINVSGGQAPYLYSIDNGLTFYTTNIFSSLPVNPAGYFITTKDDLGAFAFGFAMLTEPGKIDITMASGSQKNVTGCYGDSNGEIHFSATGGTGALDYSINGIDFFSNSGNFTGLSQGTYQPKVQDANSCIMASNSTITLTQPALLQITSELKNDVSGCYGYANGNIEISITGGTPNHYYSITNGASYSPVNNFTGLVAGGPYTVKVKDENGCTAIGGTYLISQPTQVFASSTKQDVLTCNGDETGKITVSATGGTGTYQYAISGEIYNINPVFSNVAAGIYDIYVKDANNCYAQGAQQIISQPDFLEILTETKTDVTGCFEDINGVINVTAQGGTTPLQYSIDDGVTYQFSGDFTGLPQNAYKVKIKDSKNCIAYGSDLIITRPYLLTITDASSTNVTTCSNDNNGTISITASGGTGSLNYSVDNGVTWKSTYLIDKLSAGTYTIKVKDSNGCNKTFPTNLVITAPPPLIIDSETPTNPTCFGGSDGTIKIVASGGSNPYFYSANNGVNYSVSNIVQGLTANVNNKVLVQDNKGCIATGGTFVLTEPSEIIIPNPVVQNVTSCYTGSNGSITISATGGTPGYTYSIDGGALYKSSNSFTSLSAGDYYVRVKDSKGCAKIGNTIQLTQPAQLKIVTQTHSNVNGCKGEAKGGIIIVASGGSAPLNYSINGGNTYVTNSGVFSNLLAGTYGIKVKDNEGCIVDGLNEIITEPAEFKLKSVDYSNVTCNKYNDGIISISVTGGQAPFIYSIRAGQDTSYTALFKNLKPGIYNPQILDHYNCKIVNAPIQIKEPDTILISNVDSVNIENCYGDLTGGINIYAAGGTGKLTYSVNGGNQYFDNTGVFEKLPAGEYNIQVKDSMSCKVSWSSFVHLKQPDQIKLDSIGHSSVKCYGDNDGMITIYNKGGFGKKMYSIDGGLTYIDNGGVFTQLNPGLAYSTFIQDERGCTFNAGEVSIYEPLPLAIASSNAKDESCIDFKNGSITISAYGGTPPYSYGLTDASFGSSRVIFGLIPGDYVVYVKDINNCTVKTDSLKIGRPVSVALFENDISEGCSPLTVKFTKTTGGITYLWDMGNNGSSTELNPIYTYLNTTDTVQTYNVTAYAVSGTGCEDKAYTQIKVYPQPRLEISVSPDSLFYPNTTVSIENLSTTEFSDYFWDFGDGNTSILPNPLSHTYTTCQTYTGSVKALNMWECIDTAYYDVVVGVNEPTAEFDVDTDNKCTPADIIFTDKSKNTSAYLWTFAGDTTSTERNTKHTFVPPGEYLVTYTTYGDCNTSATNDTLINVWRTPTVEFKVEPDSIMPPDQVAGFYNYSDEESREFLWEFGDGQTSQLFEPTHNYKGAKGDQTITLHVTSVNGCVDSLTIEKGIYIIPVGSVDMPLAFSPNGDGYNDYFTPGNFDSVLEYDLVIYNRWGDIVFKTNDINEKWDGRFKGRRMVQDVYVWRIIGKYSNGMPFEKAGDVTLIR